MNAEGIVVIIDRVNDATKERKEQEQEVVGPPPPHFFFCVCCTDLKMTVSLLDSPRRKYASAIVKMGAVLFTASTSETGE